MTYDHGLVERVSDCLIRIGERTIRQRNVFGGRGFMDRKSAFVIVWDTGLLVKTPRDEYEQSLCEPGVTVFAPDGGKGMGTWVVVSDESLADDPELEEWVMRGLRGVRK